MQHGVLCVLLFNFSRLWFIAAPDPKPTGRGPRRLASTTSPTAPIVNKPLMGIGSRGDSMNNPTYKALVTKYFSVITPQNELKWGSLEENPNAPVKTADADQFLQYVTSTNKQLRLHTMFARSQYPGWIEGVDKNYLRMKMDNILGIVIKRYGPKAVAMDVCNEILDNNGNPDNLPFKRILGDNWYEEAFQMAKKYRDQYAPQMLLFINEVGIEHINPKSNAMLAIATRLHKQKLLDAVGFQCHFPAGHIPRKVLQKNLERFTAVGLKVALTEIDIRSQLNGQPRASPTDTAAKTRDYGFFYETCRNVTACVSVTSWGLTPADSWVGLTKDPGWGDATLFENDFSPTPAMNLLIKKGFFPK
ncbi:hypothetical protein PGT21_011375 [Puccinia graminis f. sp. tritici]|uniref:endo-1,4-beta-xylanase n=1 Tax=Puccinia graminis f. sp. tritici TaxID=56615 RepID=A0A5B0M4W5_PUCGR|nr:hypothetical protein PGTUg99_027529 [Puccinia graminis f. sp. tritici]KAA1071551.1 hypothetical protein PGT21_011375 [Puccinia graminis f. sp. tritici]